jgi:ArsR family transcriptional regulator
MNQTLEQEVNQLHAEFCAGLADPKRLLILYTLADGPRNVSELSESLQMSQPAVSRHLKVLKERGLVYANRDGQSVIYSITDMRIIQALDLLRAVLASQLKNRAALADTAYIGAE